MSYTIRLAIALAALYLDSSASASAQDAAPPAPSVMVAGKLCRWN